MIKRLPCQAIDATWLQATLKQNASSLSPSSRFNIEFPSSFAHALAHTIRIDRESGRDALANHLFSHYLCFLPKVYLAQLDPHKPDGILSYSVDWSRLTCLQQAIANLFELLQANGINPLPIFGVDSPTALTERFGDIASIYRSTCYGGFAPLLYAQDHDLKSYSEEFRDIHHLVDERLSGPLMHELCHMGRHRELAFPLILDEGIAAFIGSKVARFSIYPLAGHNNAIMGAPWFVQIGQSLSRIFGFTNILRAHCGLISWEDATSPSFVKACHHIGWQQYRHQPEPHFLWGYNRPFIWHKLCHLASSGHDLSKIDLASLDRLTLASIESPIEDPLDRDTLRDGLLAMCLRATLIGGSYRVANQLPSFPIQLDLLRCRIEREQDSESVEHEAPLYLFPPAVATRLRAKHNWRRGQLKVHDLDAVHLAVDAIIAGDRGRTDGFDLSWD